MNRQPFGSPWGCWPDQPPGTTGQLPEPVASACWRLVRLLEYLSSNGRQLSALYYSPRGYWKGLAAIEKLASAAKVTEQQAKDWLKGRPSGRSICLPHGAYRGRSLTWRYPTRSTRRICSFCHTTMLGGKPSATLSWSLM